MKTSIWSSSPDLSILLGLGNGSFARPVKYDVGDGARSVAVGDLNRDGALDLTVANAVSPGFTSVLLGRGDGTFTDAVSYDAGDTSVSIALADIDGDRTLDITTANNSAFDDDLSILLGRGDGTFNTPVHYQLGANAGTGTWAALVVQDLNADGKRDIVVTNEVDNVVSVLLGQAGE